MNNKMRMWIALGMASALATFSAGAQAVSSGTATITTPTNNSFVNAPAKIRGSFAPVGIRTIKSATLKIQEVESGNFWTGSAWQGSTTTFPIVIDVPTNTFGANNGPGTVNVTNGRHYAITAIVTDSSDVVATSPTVTVTSDTVIPNITVNNAPAMSSVISSLPTTITGTASDVLSGSGLRDVRLSLRRFDGLNWNGTAWVAGAPGSVQVLATGTATWSVPTPQGINLLNGSYQMVVASYDNAGNANSITRVFTIDNAIPLDLIFTVIGNALNPSDGTTVSTLTPIQGLAVDDLSGIARVELIIQRNSTGKYWNGSAWQTGSFTLTTGLATPLATPYETALTPWARDNALPDSASLAPGSYTITATAVDRGEHRLERVIVVQVAN